MKQYTFTMHSGTRPKGYTIVETLLFLAISGVMFLLAITFISGKQHKSEFRQGLNETHSDIRQVINDVDNGFFPSNSDFSCQAADSPIPGLPGAAPTFSPPPPAQPQGTNLGCIFLGKVIQFGPLGTNKTGYNVYTVAGRQYKISQKDGTVVANFSEAKPTVVPNLTQRNTFPWGLQIIKVVSVSTTPAGSTTTTDINGVGFFSSFGNVVGGDLQSGSQGVVVVPIPGSKPFPELELQIIGDITTEVNDAAAAAAPNPTITICFDSQAGQYGTLVIGGGNGQRLTTKIQAYNVKTDLPGIC